MKLKKSIKKRRNFKVKTKKKNRNIQDFIRLCHQLLDYLNTIGFFENHKATDSVCHADHLYKKKKKRNPP